MNARGALPVHSHETDREERATRLDVALTYRLIHHYSMSDLTDGFVCGRLASADDVIIGGYGRLPELVTASSLHRRSLSAELAIEQHGGVDVDAMRFARTVFGARPAARACLHAHPFYAMVFSALEADFEPISQYAFMYAGRVGYVRYLDGDVTSSVMGKEIEAAMNGADAILLRNHGLLVWGDSPAHAFWVLYRLEQTCRIQVEAMQTGAKVATPPIERLADIQRSYWHDEYIQNDGQREWTELARLLDRKDASWRD